jgi:hypothetical protein
MGIYLKPLKKRARSESFNWSSWEMLTDLLSKLECDTSEVSNSNDGEYVSPETCKEWALALKGILNSKRLSVYTNPFNTEIFQLDCDKERGNRKPNKDDIDFLKNAIKFFEKCEGFRQF